jgi:ion channel
MKPSARLQHLWRSEKGLSAMLVFLILTILVGAPLVATGAVGGFVFDVLFSLLLVTGVITVAQRPLLTVTVSVLTVASLALRWASSGSPESTMRLWAYGLSIPLLSILAALVLWQVFREGPITTYRIQGAIVVYLLIGFVWTAAYELVIGVLPGAFHFAQGGPGEARSVSGLVYYSFVTLTTLGYGDITPIHPTARSLAIAEALMGQLYPAILIARLVSMRISSRRDG